MARESVDRKRLRHLITLLLLALDGQDDAAVRTAARAITKALTSA